MTDKININNLIKENEELKVKNKELEEKLKTYTNSEENKKLLLLFINLNRAKNSI